MTLRVLLHDINDRRAVPETLATGIKNTNVVVLVVHLVLCDELGGALQSHFRFVLSDQSHIRVLGRKQEKLAGSFIFLPLELVDRSAFCVHPPLGSIVEDHG